MIYKYVGKGSTTLSLNLNTERKTMSKIINLIQDHNLPQSELSPEEAKYLDLKLNHAELVALDGGHKLSFDAAIEEHSWGHSFVVRVKDTVTNEIIGRLDSPMIAVITKGVYELNDEEGRMIRVVCFDTLRRSEIEE